MRTMYDSVTASSIPVDAEMVAGYVDPDGTYTWTAEDWARFPNAVKVRIAGHASTNDGHVLDVEAGDATPSQAPGWVRMRRNSGLSQASVYCSLAIWDQVKQEFIAQNVDMPEWWIAAYPGNGPQLYPGSVAHQYEDTGPYDLSVIADFWPGVDMQGDGDLTAQEHQMLADTLTTAQNAANIASDVRNAINDPNAGILKRLSDIEKKLGI